jgi:hypothetical protein
MYPLLKILSNNGCQKQYQWVSKLVKDGELGVLPSLQSFSNFPLLGTYWLAWGQGGSAFYWRTGRTGFPANRPAGHPVGRAFQVILTNRSGGRTIAEGGKDSIPQTLAALKTGQINNPHHHLLNPKTCFLLKWDNFIVSFLRVCLIFVWKHNIHFLFLY